MANEAMSRVTTRRELLKTGGWMAGAGMVSSLLPKGALAGAFGHQSASGTQAAQPAAQLRAHHDVRTVSDAGAILAGAAAAITSR